VRALAREAFDFDFVALEAKLCIGVIIMSAMHLVSNYLEVGLWVRVGYWTEAELYYQRSISLVSEVEVVAVDFYCSALSRPHSSVAQLLEIRLKCLQAQNSLIRKFTAEWFVLCV
jgi:hypothetical protein